MKPIDQWIVDRIQAKQAALACTTHHTCDCTAFELELLRSVVLDIYHAYGHLCDRHETCQHIACHDSHASWELCRQVVETFDNLGWAAYQKSLKGEDYVRAG